MKKDRIGGLFFMLFIFVINGLYRGRNGNISVYVRDSVSVLFLHNLFPSGFCAPHQGEERPGEGLTRRVIQILCGF